MTKSVCFAVSSSSLRMSSSTPESSSSSAPRKVFVAGGTGRTGIRIVKELVDRRVMVRVGCRDVVKGTKAMEERYGHDILDFVEFVPMTLEEKSIQEAMGDADRVVSALGASELVPWGPFNVDARGTINVIRAASASSVVQHFVLVSSLGTGNPFLFPAGILNLFWGILIWKRTAELFLIRSGLAFTIVRPGGMERPQDDFKLTHNIVLRKENSMGGGLVSRLQVAEVVVNALFHPEASKGKVAEVVAETSAPIEAIETLFERLPRTL